MIAALLVYVFAAFGLAYIVGHAVISRAIREALHGPDEGDTAGIVLTARRIVVDLAECPACFGFWTGVVAAFIGAVPFTLHGAAGVVAWGLFTSGSNYFLARVTNLIAPPS